MEHLEEFQYYSEGGHYWLHKTKLKCGLQTHKTHYDTCYSVTSKTHDDKLLQVGYADGDGAGGGGEAYLFAETKYPYTVVHLWATTCASPATSPGVCVWSIYVIHVCQ